jgi:hypothetical protein
MAADLESARRDWEDASRRFEEEAHDSRRAEPLRLQLETVLTELRKRVGGRFTLKELASEYRSSDAWVRSVIAEQATAPDWPRTLSIVEGAAFYAYSRGAVDYSP